MQISGARNGRPKYAKTRPAKTLTCNLTRSPCASTARAHTTYQPLETRYNFEHDILAVVPQLHKTVVDKQCKYEIFIVPEIKNNNIAVFIYVTLLYSAVRCEDLAAEES